MAKKITVRWKHSKKDREWMYLEVEEHEVLEFVNYLKSMGYIVEY